MAGLSLADLAALSDQERYEYFLTHPLVADEKLPAQVTREFLARSRAHSVVFIAQREAEQEVARRAS